MRDETKELKKKLAECILEAILAFFNAVGPVWNFFFVKRPDGGSEQSPKVPIGTQS